ncbi:MAG: Maf family protein [Candidatus Cloacimonadaceae bacterium]|jgi:septum formation protein|nr:Maf family protein [Candidatus Cloacimonadota bacterium]MDY0126546.1 Maf family protein [Candidatus Cloacimonadaceae bacterium]MCB5254646.1 Maf family protein [Candidatus Cloacimonadota bacterium]MCK9177733.1 Maf family protein [Candidatus Cloacimonadota bacterium]MCK9241907.1 Maf family protein [Candidatus Cloacimonadota bacterium]
MLDKILNEYKVILASQSPRRRDIFDMLGINYHTQSSNIAEPITGEDPALQAMRNARNKAEAVFATGDGQSVIVSADTIVVLEGRILGKPESAEQAYGYLSDLRANTHTVITGICMMGRKGQKCGYEQTQVSFAPLTDEEIRDYIKTQEPADKAGAYGIQGFGSQFITRIEGCYFNVMGFPVRRFYEITKDLIARGLL